MPYTSPLVIALTAVYFLAASVNTFDIRMHQAVKFGQLPPDEPMLPAWSILFTFVMWGVWLALLYLNWKYALVLFILKFILKVLPVLETVGNILCAPMKWGKR